MNELAESPALGQQEGVSSVSGGRDRMIEELMGGALKEARLTLNAPISMKEMRAAKERMHTGKAGGIDGVPIEFFLGIRTMEGEAGQGGRSILVSALDELMLCLFNLILETGVTCSSYFTFD